MRRGGKVGKVICIDGPIGAGKSTIINLLIKKLGGYISNYKILFSPEPVEKWRNVGDKNLNILQKFYDDKARYSFTFQFNAFVTRCEQIDDIISKEGDENFVLFVERGIYSDRYVFAELLYELGFLEEIEWEIYKKNFDYLSNKIIGIDGYIYMNYDTKICIEREEIRAREEEKNVDKNYFVKVCEKYQKVIKINEEKNIPILKINEIFDKSGDDEIFEIVVEKITKFVEKL